MDSQVYAGGHYCHPPNCSRELASLEQLLLLDAFLEIKYQDIVIAEVSRHLQVSAVQTRWSAGATFYRLGGPFTRRPTWS